MYWAPNHVNVVVPISLPWRTFVAGLSSRSPWEMSVIYVAEVTRSWHLKWFLLSASDLLNWSKFLANLKPIFLRTRFSLLSPFVPKYSLITVYSWTNVTLISQALWVPFLTNSLQKTSDCYQFLFTPNWNTLSVYICDNGNLSFVVSLILVILQIHKILAGSGGGRWGPDGWLVVSSWQPEVVLGGCAHPAPPDKSHKSIRRPRANGSLGPRPGPGASNWFR